MADAINTGNPVATTKFIVNDYEDIRGGRVNQETPRGRMALLDTDGRFTLPRTLAESQKAVFVVDWPKPLNPGPYFEGPGLNGAPPYGMNDGSFGMQENDFSLDPDQNFQTPWPVGYTTYDIPPMFLNVNVTSGNKVLVFDGGTFTFGSGAYTGVLGDYTYGTSVYAAYTSGDEGKIAATVSGSSTVVGHIFDKEIFGANTITVVLKGRRALA